MGQCCYPDRPLFSIERKKWTRSLKVYSAHDPHAGLLQQCRPLFGILYLNVMDMLRMWEAFDQENCDHSLVEKRFKCLWQKGEEIRQDEDGLDERSLLRMTV